MKGHKPHTLGKWLPLFVEGHIIHYTCNAPKQEVLDKYRIKSVGDKWDCVNPREVLEIPFGLYEKRFGPANIVDEKVLIINLEKLMRDLK